jgi:hypothetical protein
VLALALLLPAAVLATPGPDGQEIKIESAVTHAVYGNSQAANGSSVPPSTDPNYPNNNTVWITSSGNVSGGVNVYGGFSGGIDNITVEENEVLVDGGTVNVTGTGSVYGGYARNGAGAAGTITAKTNAVTVTDAGKVTAVNIYGGHAVAETYSGPTAEGNSVTVTGSGSEAKATGSIYGGWATCANNSDTST